MGVWEWLFNGGDDRAEAHADLDNRKSKPHKELTLKWRAMDAQSRAQHGQRKLTPKEAKAKAAERRGWFGTNSGTHRPTGKGWWD